MDYNSCREYTLLDFDHGEIESDSLGRNTGMCFKGAFLLFLVLPDNGSRAWLMLGTSPCRPQGFQVVGAAYICIP